MCFSVLTFTYVTKLLMPLKHRKNLLQAGYYLRERENVRLEKLLCSTSDFILPKSRDYLYQSCDKSKSFLTLKDKEDINILLTQVPNLTHGVKKDQTARKGFYQSKWYLGGLAYIYLEFRSLFYYPDLFLSNLLPLTQFYKYFKIRIL
jgi:hypothetical protein